MRFLAEQTVPGRKTSILISRNRTEQEMFLIVGYPPGKFYHGIADVLWSKT